MEQIHASCIAIDGQGVLLRGPSGSGKSDLALRLIDDGGELVADDRVNLGTINGQIIASVPENIRGLLEVRGVGIVQKDARDETPLRLVVDLVSADDVERMPEPARVLLRGVEIPSVRLDPFQASTPAKIRTALARQI